MANGPIRKGLTNGSAKESTPELVWFASGSKALV
jgi:hypothetical protein